MPRAATPGAPCSWSALRTSSSCRTGTTPSRVRRSRRTLDGVVPVRPFAMRRVRLTPAAPGAKCHGGTAEKRGQKPITGDVAVPRRGQAAR